MNISGKTQLIGLLGWPISHSFSPAMHNAAAEAAGLDWAYVPLPVRPNAVATAVRGLPALGFRGVNVTVPHKQAVMPLLNEIESGAKAIGAVNTILISQGESNQPHLAGYNTDWSGFLADLNELKVDITGRDCLLLGAGGSARAVAYGLARKGARIHILARRVAQAEALKTDLSAYVSDELIVIRPLTALPALTPNLIAPLIVNCTPLGMSPHVQSSPWPENVSFPNGSFVYDLVYNPKKTKLINQAIEGGCQAANGLGMLIWQGAKAFEIFTGVQPDVRVMRQAVGV